MADTSEPGWLLRLTAWAGNNSIMLLRVSPERWKRIRDSRNGTAAFSLAFAHDDVRAARRNTICLISVDDAPEELYLGIIKTRSAATTVETRLRIVRCASIHPSSLAELAAVLPQGFQRAVPTGAATRPLVVLPHPLSLLVLDTLAGVSDNHHAMQSVAAGLSIEREGNDELQIDALGMALKAFGLAPESPALSVDLTDSRSALEAVQLMEDTVSRTKLAGSDGAVRLLEDNVVEYDARYIDGFTFDLPDATGHARFVRGSEVLDVYTANKRPLERVFGVDLIYFNASRKSIVMVQYKMLERRVSRTGIEDWSYTPDSQLNKELSRMRKFGADEKTTAQDYRLNARVFYFKFVKRIGTPKPQAIILPLDHFEALLAESAAPGTKNPVRVSYNALDGRYLRETTFLELVSAGYIGSPATTTEFLRALIEQTISSGRAAVVGVQRGEGLAIGEA